MGRSRYEITQPDAPHFITLTVLHWMSDQGTTCR